MSELQLESIPDKAEYAAVTQRCDAEFKKLGGVLLLIQNYEILASEGNYESIYDEVRSLGKIAFSLEPKNDRGIAEDKGLQVTHAFKRGMMTATRTSRELYSRRISAKEIRASLYNGVPQTEASTGGAVLEDTPLFEWGRTGLGIAGETAVGYVDGWASQVTKDITLQGIFKLGWGAFTATAHALAVNRNLDRVSAYFATDEWETDLSEILAPNTGE